METFKIWNNEYLSVNTPGYHNTYYIGYKSDGNPDYLNDLKNTFGTTNSTILSDALLMVYSKLLQDIPGIVSAERLVNPICVCVPRSKANMAESQMYFRDAVSGASQRIAGVEDGSNVIVRTINTRTTHIKKECDGFLNDGDMPYPGITKATCQIDSRRIRGRDVILIDDIYTKNVNIDEDCIQAMYDNGANRVVFYSIALTRRG